MRLTIIGCSGSGPSAASCASCYLVEEDGFAIVVDLGSGALVPLLGRMSVSGIGAIALSHLHADHCLDMVPLAVALHYGRERPPQPIPVLAPAEAPRRLAQANYPGTPDSFFAELFAFTAVDGSTGSSQLGPFTVTTARMDHPVPTVGYRITAGDRTLAYSGDTGPTAALVELARDADTLLCEASWADGPEQQSNLHLTAAAAAEHATAAGVGRLLITHVPAWESSERAAAVAAEVFRGPVEAVTAGAQYEI
ncbi:MAG: MBL fold metallo-hydrolase [bacterium]